MWRVWINTVVSVHCHDDLGLAVANSLAALDAGARQVECTINGIGERAGNASLEEVVMALRVRKDLTEHHTDIETTVLYKASQLLSHITGIHPQPNKAIVGRNAFSHEAGIHQHGMFEGAHDVRDHDSGNGRRSRNAFGLRKNTPDGTACAIGTRSSVTT